ncbi:MAG: NUDIX hydrolase [Oscillospiraceae bacterium]|nr:NUDIX hydrolase [Oscillospiraceae bacterium]
MSDILFRKDGWVFSYRVAGIAVKNGKVLLQKTTADDAYAFPGGHVELGETNEETLIREFKEEIGADISVGDLRWVAEVFFPWGESPCHQICLYYDIEITDENTPKDGMFMAKEHIEGRNFELEFHWVPIEKTGELEIYPENAKELLKSEEKGVKHFIYKE